MSRFIIPRNEVDGHFKDLETALKSKKIPTMWGGFATPDRFMLMRVDEKGTRFFKNADTRNYLYLLKNNRIKVPTGWPWHRGFF